MTNSDNSVSGFVPVPSDSRENGDYLTIFDGTTFTDRYGTQITFSGASVYQPVSTNRNENSGTENHYFVAASQVADRLGNKLTYTYPSNASPDGSTANTIRTLIPSTITFSGSANQTLYISQDDSGHVLSIWDPNGNRFDYTYQDKTYFANNRQYAEKVLTSVTGPDGRATHYDYALSLETDLTPDDITNGQRTDKLHLDVSQIVDPAGNTYQITYGFDHTKYSYDIWSSGYYPQTGAPSCVTRVDLPGGWGSASFSNQGSVTALNPQTDSDGTMHLTGDSNRQVHVTDAGGNGIDYHWSDTHVFLVGGVYPNTPPAAVPKVVFYNTMDIGYGVGTEEFTFDPTAGMALKSIRDLSGNMTTYSYGDSYSPPTASIYSKVFRYPNFATKYPDPTEQRDALGQSKSFHYGTQYRIMDVATDEAGRSKVYQLDDLGRRLTEEVYGSGGGLAQMTSFAYEDDHFPGVVTTQDVHNLNNLDWASDLVTFRWLDGNGRVTTESVGGLTSSYSYDPNGNRLAATDPRGLTTGFQYDGRNRLTLVVYADGSMKTIGYYANGSKQSETDENGNYSSYEYDALNRLTRQTKAGGIVTQFFYQNAVKPKTTIIDPDGGSTSMQYDSLLRLTALTDALGRQTSYGYGANSGAHGFDSSGFRPTEVVDGRGYHTYITYDALYRPVTKSVQYQLTPALYATTNTAYDAVGNPYLVTDPLGHQTATEFDALSRPTLVTHADGSQTQAYYTSTGLKWKVRDELGQETETHYDAAGRPVLVMGPAVDDGLNPTDTNRAPHLTRPQTRSTYDGAGNVVTTTNQLGEQWNYVYDARNRKIEEDQPAVLDAVSGQVTQPVILTGYDYAGNVLWVQDARGFTTETTYDVANRPLTVTAPPVLLAGGSGAVRPITSKTYDPAGNVLTATDPNGHVTVNTYDALHHLTSTTDAAGIVVSYEYDAAGNRTKVTDGLNQVTTFTYDGLNRNTGSTDASGHTTRFDYDAINKTARTDSLGQVTQYTYDVRNRLTAVTYPGRTDENRGYSYDLAGNLLSVTEPGKGGVADVSYTYDHLHRVITETSGGATHTYRYDLAGNRLGVQYGRIGGAAGQQIESTYDALNRLSTLTEGGRMTVYDYDLSGNVVGKTLPNGDAVVSHYDSLGHAYEEEGVSSQGVLYYYLSLCDAVGNLESSFEYTANLPLRTVTMGYDAINRLTSETVTDSNGAVVTDTSYQYDAANNRTHKTANGVTATYSYNNTNELTGWSDTNGQAVTYGYDSNGNRITRTANGATDNYGYDPENRLETLVKNTAGGTGSYSYVYDYRTRRVERTENGLLTQVVFSGGTSVQEYDQPSILNPQPTAEYVRGSDWGGGVGGILYTMRGGNASFDHYDRRGDVTSRTDSNGNVTWQASYEAFGTRTQEQGATQDRQKANTKDEDPTGLLNEGMRYRDLETGVFITADPTGFVDGPNLYAYVRQNPWTKFDPEGLSENSPTVGQAWTYMYFHDGDIDMAGAGKTPDLVTATTQVAGATAQSLMLVAPGPKAVAAAEREGVSLVDGAAKPGVLSKVKGFFGAVKDKVSAAAGKVGGIFKHGEGAPTESAATATTKAAEEVQEAAPAAKGVDTGLGPHAPGDVPNDFTVVKGGTKPPLPPGEEFSTSYGPTLNEAGAGVPHGQVQPTTAGQIRKNGGIVVVAPEKTGEVMNYQHANVTEGSAPTVFGPPVPNPVPKSDRIGGPNYGN